APPRIVAPWAIPGAHPPIPSASRICFAAAAMPRAIGLTCSMRPPFSHACKPLGCVPERLDLRGRSRCSFSQAVLARRYCCLLSNRGLDPRPGDVVPPMGTAADRRDADAASRAAVDRPRNVIPKAAVDLDELGAACRVVVVAVGLAALAHHAGVGAH